jgi:hypothetical protein
MPNPNNPFFQEYGGAQTTLAAPASTNPFEQEYGSASTADETPATDDSSSSWLKALGMAAGVGVAGYAASKLPFGKAALESAGNFLNSARQQSMLSGLAPLKSFLGNVGAAVEQSAIQRDMSPLKEFFSATTARDALQTFKDNPVPSGVEPTLIDKLWTPGRVMQSLDTATQNALVRGGLSADAAQTAVMQAPLPQKLQEALDSPMGRYLVPFRRTPFNQFIEGFGRFGKNFDPVVTPAYMAAGAAHGYATSDDKAPLSLPLAIAGAASHGVPYAVSAIAGRIAGNHSAVPDSQLASSVLPVSEYGITQSAEDPLAWIKHPAIFKAIQTLLGR